MTELSGALRAAIVGIAIAVILLAEAIGFDNQRALLPVLAGVRRCWHWPCWCGRSPRASAAPSRRIRPMTTSRTARRICCGAGWPARRCWPTAPTAPARTGIEYEGTYPLPEAQLDRFAMQLRLGYLSEQDETQMIRRRLERGAVPPQVGQVVDAAGLMEMRDAVEFVTVHPDVVTYVVSLAAATRGHPQVEVGASPRAELDLVQMARARALLLGRDYVIPEDVKALAVAAMAHRITLRPEMWVRRIRGEDVIAELLRRLPVPRAGVT